MFENLLFSATTLNWFLVCLAAFIIGLSKSGLKGLDMMNVALMAIVFGGKASTGIVLPLLCIGDMVSVWYYNRHAQWSHFWKLMPWMVVGILVGVFAGKDLDEAIFRKVMAVIIIIVALIMILLELRKTFVIPTNKLFVSGMGLISGFTTMLGNLAGPFANIYFLAMRLPKNDFIGTSAWIFLIINLFKLPFQVVFWKNINGQTLVMDLYLLPALVLGFWLGLKIVNRIREDGYRKVILALTLTGAVFIFLR
jgi:uncharacterized membrane protein YfcA